MNGGSLHVGSGSGSGVLRMFDLTQTYAQAMARPDMGWDVVPSPAGSIETQCGWDPVKTQLLCRGHVYAAYFPDQNRWQAFPDLQNQGAWFGGDVDAMSTVDVAGRWMYVIGSGFAERINLDTYAWQDLGQMAWAKSGGGGSLGFTHAQNVVWGDSSGYIPGPGLAWYEPARSIIAYVDANRILLFDPTKDQLPTPYQIGGPDQTLPGMIPCPVPTPCGPGGLIFGRFALIPGTTNVALATGVDRNVAVATLNLSAPAPVPTPTASPAPPSTLALAPTPTPAPSPTPPATSTTTAASVAASTPIAAAFLGIDQDKTGQLRLAPDGQADFHIRLTGLTSAPAKVTITDAGSGTWEWPFNGTNWLVLAQGTDLWFSVWSQASQRFHVKVTYPDGSMAETDATGNAVPIPAPAPTPTAAASPSPSPTPAAAPAGGGYIQVPVGQPIPVGQWVMRPHKGAPCPSTDGVAIAEQQGLCGTKHSRVFYHPGLKSMVVGGGDRPVSMLRPEGTPNGTGTEIIAYNAETDTWTTLRKFCVPGETQPERPDTVIWALDRKRNRGLMAPGFYFGTQAQQSGCGAIETNGAYAFDFATKKFIGPNDPSIMVPMPNTPEFQGGGGEATVILASGSSTTSTTS
jgi:hypothetical protein